MKSAARVANLVSTTRLRRREEGGSQTSCVSEVGLWPWSPVRGDVPRVSACSRTVVVKRGSSSGPDVHETGAGVSLGPRPRRRVAWPEPLHGARRHRSVGARGDAAAQAFPLKHSAVGSPGPSVAPRRGAALTRRRIVSLQRMPPWAASARGKAGGWRGRRVSTVGLRRLVPSPVTRKSLFSETGTRLPNRALSPLSRRKGEVSTPFRHCVP